MPGKIVVRAPRPSTREINSSNAAQARRPKVETIKALRQTLRKENRCVYIFFPELFPFHVTPRSTKLAANKNILSRNSGPRDPFRTRDRECFPSGNRSRKNSRLIGVEGPIDFQRFNLFFFLFSSFKVLRGPWTVSSTRATRDVRRCRKPSR